MIINTDYVRTLALKENMSGLNWHEKCVFLFLKQTEY